MIKVRCYLTVLFNLILFTAPIAVIAEQYTVVNPHWNSKACISCHLSIPKEGGSVNLKFGDDFISLCNSCHETVSRNKYIHSVAMLPLDDQLERMPEEFRKAVKKDKEGRLTCIVCHELKYQCLSSEYYRKETNPRFFRGGPYAQRSDICYHCHDKSKYEKLKNLFYSMHDFK